MAGNEQSTPRMPTPAGYQKHPSTKVAHYFPEGSDLSICKREHRTNSGHVDAEPGIFPCGHCKKKLDKLGAGYAG